MGKYLKSSNSMQPILIHSIR